MREILISKSSRLFDSFIIKEVKKKQQKTLSLDIHIRKKSEKSTLTSNQIILFENFNKKQERKDYRSDRCDCSYFFIVTNNNKRKNIT